MNKQKGISVFLPAFGVKGWGIAIMGMEIGRAHV